MDERTIGFLIWAACGCVFIGIGIRALFAKQPVHFWANVKAFPVKEPVRYNRALSKLFILYGLVFIALGTPLLGGQNTPYIVLSVVGVMLETIVAMAVYTVLIEGKYKG